MTNNSAEATFNPFQTQLEAIPFNVPDAYKEKEWVKNLAKTSDPTGEFFKQFEHAQALIGQRQQITPPGPDATPEQVKAFHQALGVPSDVKAYEVKPVDWAPELKPIGDQIAASRSEGFMNDMKQAAMENGVTPAQFQKFVEAHDRALVKNHAAELQQRQQENQALEQDFGKLTDQWFGAEKTYVLDRGQKLIAENIPPQMKGLLAKQSNEVLVLLAAAMNGVDKKYIQEDGFRTGTGTQSQVATGQQARHELIALQKTAAYKDPMHPDHDATVRKVNEGYKNLPQEALNKSIGSF
jgi:hypothetical protein